VETIVTALRQREGREDRSYEPPDAAELIDLGLGSCDCKELRHLELFSSVLSDRNQDLGLRVRAAAFLATVDDPAAEEAVRVAASDPIRAIRMVARQGLDLRDTVLQEKRAWRQRARPAGDGHSTEGQ
jgi:hypothetical protein